MLDTRRINRNAFFSALAPMCDLRAKLRLQCNAQKDECLSFGPARNWPIVCDTLCSNLYIAGEHSLSLTYLSPLIPPDRLDIIRWLHCHCKNSAYGWIYVFLVLTYWLTICLCEEHIHVVMCRDITNHLLFCGLQYVW